MGKSEKIIGRSINSWGGIDVNYWPTGFNIGQGGVILNGYSDSGCRITNNSNIRD